MERCFGLRAPKKLILLPCKPLHWPSVDLVRIKLHFLPLKISSLADIQASELIGSYLT